MPVSVEQELATAKRFYLAGAFVEALTVLLRIPEASRHSIEYLLLAGATQGRRQQWKKALSAFNELLALDPNCFEALTWMTQLTEGADAVAYARRAVEAQPEDASGYDLLGVLLLQQQSDAAAAIEPLLMAVTLAPDDFNYRRNLANAYLIANQHIQAIAQLRRCIELEPAREASYLLLGHVYHQFGQLKEMTDVLEEGLERVPESSELHALIADAYSLAYRNEKAEDHLITASTLSPRQTAKYGAWLQSQSRFDEATQIFRQLLSDPSLATFAAFSLVSIKQYSGTAETILGLPRPDVYSKIYAEYALGHFHDRHKDFERAMLHYDAANEASFKVHNYGAHAMRTREEHEWALSVFDKCSDIGSSKEAPVFIVGLPRSGTTLLDQIISSHPKVIASGELRFWMVEAKRLSSVVEPLSHHHLNELAERYCQYARSIAGDSQRFTDKMPLNFANIGLIHRALPEARFLHIMRHPVDVSLSLWTTYFDRAPLFAYDKQRIVDYYHEYERQMHEWRRRIPANRLLDIRYEDLIDRSAELIPSVINFCGLDWNEACLHPDQNSGPINTPSNWQARQPIYGSSVERWRNYEPWLGAFAQLLNTG